MHGPLIEIIMEIKSQGKYFEYESSNLLKCSKHNFVSPTRKIANVPKFPASWFEAVSVCRVSTVDIEV